MRWKQNLTPLDAVPHIDPQTQQRLVDNHITTAEELVGQIESAPESIRELLDLDGSELLDLDRRAKQVIAPDTARAMERQRGRRYPLGALPPEELD